MQQEPRSVHTTSDEEATAELAGRLRTIEALPLDQRAVAFGAVHDELRVALEGTGGDTGETDDSPGGR
ncbi:hypothetical protein IFT77_00015 [Frigoribacterium sp. CFBP 13729]|uniref:hypothetical protein n=1 Tax=Frigoribacterium sp. CFBP 13729 TaxID=2775293 RepID=UPI0017809E83|nr:hypothetical protein [Frigoribacterium sp. CFBP 13729]MBD8608871.1 hypothetical protein [Frigoribacterium sp. CFBP 13729]